MFSSSFTLKWRDVYITSLCIWIDLNDFPVTNRKERKWPRRTSKAESHKTMKLGSYLLAHLPSEPWVPWEKPKHPGAKLWGAMPHGENICSSYGWWLSSEFSLVRHQTCDWTKILDDSSCPVSHSRPWILHIRDSYSALLNTDHRIWI